MSSILFDCIQEIGIYANIFRYLSFNTMVNMGIINKKLNKIFNNSLLWTNMISISFNKFKSIDIKQPHILYKFLI